jgi:hypothetical protein
MEVKPCRKFKSRLALAKQKRLSDLGEGTSAFNWPVVLCSNELFDGQRFREVREINKPF